MVGPGSIFISLVTVSSNVSLYVSPFVLSSVSFHAFTICLLIVLLPTLFHYAVSFNDDSPSTYLVFYMSFYYMSQIYLSKDEQYIN
jgi:hypothetical protein